MPKIVRFHSIGGPENLKIEEVAFAQPGEGEVKLRVQAVGLNRAEAGFMRGQYFETPQLPSRIGYEAAGVVEAVGPGVDPSWVGKQVATVPGFSMSKNGVLGEEAVVPVESLGEYPAKLSPVEAAAIWMQYLTAYGALITYGGIEARRFRGDHRRLQQRGSRGYPDCECGRRYGDRRDAKIEQAQRTACSGRRSRDCHRGRRCRPKGE